MYNGVYPAYIRPYTQVKPKMVQRKGEGEQGSSASREEMRERNSQNGGGTVRANNYQLAGYRNLQAQKQNKENVQTINVSQIITDFRGTASAVGAPKDVTDEVNAYLALIQTQAEKDSPNPKIINSNLKNASQVLDAYITKTLKTQSNVVENWVDALFLQKIDYKADPNAINENLKLNLGGNDEKQAQQAQQAAQQAQQIVQSEEAQKVVTKPETRNYVPSDEKMKELFIRAKKAAANEEPKVALIFLKKALNYAIETQDTKMQSMVYYETADLYNKRGMFPQALKGYKVAADLASDENLIAKSYMKTGKIYDEAGLLEPAKQHWLSAIGFAGESENLPLQVKALDNLAEVQSEVFDSKNAYMFTNLANSIAEETKDDKVKGYAYKRAFNVSDYLDDKSKAMQYLKLSTKAYTNAQDDKNVINNYMAAADIMLNVGNQTKARALLNKAFMTALDSDNKEFLPEISSKIAKLAA